MATSGNYTTSKVGNWCLKFTWTRTGTNVTNNTSTINYTWTVQNSTAGTYRTVYARDLWVNGTNVLSSTSSKAYYHGDVMKTGNITITHNNDGTKTFVARAKIGVGITPGTNIDSTSGNFTLTAIPRYAAITTFTLGSTTFNSTKVTWATDKNVNQVQYAINNGSWVTASSSTAKSGSFTISGLAHSTAYNIKIRVRAADSSLYTEAGNKSVTTPTGLATISSFTVAKRDETSVTVAHAQSPACDLIEISKDNGSTWATLASNKIVTGLEANTKYNFKLRVRRTDSQLKTTSGTVAQTTYAYPAITSTPTITIGTSATIGFSNPLSRSCTIYIIGDNAASKSAGASTGTSIAGFNNADWKTFLYSTIPAKTSATYKVRLVCSAVSRDTTVTGGTYKVIGNSTEDPTFTDFDITDGDALAPFLTGQNGVNNNTIYIAGMSDIVSTVPAAKKATSSVGASLKNYTSNWGGQSSNSPNTVNYSSTAAVSCTSWDGNGTSIALTATDNRGRSKTVTKSGLTIIKPTIASASLKADRKDGIENITYLHGNIKYWSGDWANGSSRPNQLFTIVMKVDTGLPVDITQKILDNSTITTSGGITTITLNDRSVLIHENEAASNGFTVGKQFGLTFNVFTGVSTSYYYDNNRQVASIKVPDGKIGMSRMKNTNGNYHYGINGMPVNNEALTLYGSLAMDVGAGPKSVLRTFPHSTGDNSGDALILQARGLTIVGAGEAGSNLYNQLIADGFTPQDEQLYLASDQNVRIVTACNTIADRKQFEFLTNGNFRLGAGGNLRGGTSVSLNNETVGGGWVCLRPNDAAGAANGEFAVPADGNNGNATIPKSVLRTIYPVGSIVVTSNNTNPQSRLGGTWECVYKLVKNRSVGSTTDGTLFKMNTTNLSAFSFNAYIRNNVLRIVLTMTNKVEIGDSTLVLGNILMDQIGILGFNNYWAGPVFSDANNGLIEAYITADGQVETRDYLTRARRTTCCWKRS